ncbi:MAG: hypothetical protein ABSE21_20620, partial [Bryobacteraceae bacterium]
MKLIPLFAASLILACFAAPVPAAAPGGARNDAWEVIGPGGGGSMYHPTISPHDPNVALVGCDMTGAYLTRDGGKSWRMINLRGVAQFFVFDPSNANTIYIYSVGLWRSTDAGATWALVHPNPKSVTGIAMLDDHAEAEFRATGEAEAITALAVDPKNSQALYAVFTAKDGPSLRRSADGGRTWTHVAAGLPAGSKNVIIDNVASGLPAGAEHIYIDPDSPSTQRTVYVVGRNSVAVVEGGALRQGAAAPEPFLDASAGFPGKGAKAVIYGVARGAVYVSRDGGATWERQMPGGQLQAVATSLFHPNVAYVS